MSFDGSLMTGFDISILNFAYQMDDMFAFFVQQLTTF